MYNGLIVWMINYVCRFCNDENRGKRRNRRPLSAIPQRIIGATLRNFGIDLSRVFRTHVDDRPKGDLLDKQRDVIITSTDFTSVFPHSDSFFIHPTSPWHWAPILQTMECDSAPSI